MHACDLFRGKGKPYPYSPPPKAEPQIIEPPKKKGFWARLLGLPTETPKTVYLEDSEEDRAEKDYWEEEEELDEFLTTEEEWE